MWKKSTLSFMKVIQTQTEVCRCIFHAIMWTNWFKPVLSAWMQLNFSRKLGGRGIVLLNIGICSCVEEVLQHLLYILIFSACQTSLWSYRDWLGWIWSGHQNIFQWSQWKTGKIIFSICCVPYAIIIDWCFFKPWLPD